LRHALAKDRGLIEAELLSVGDRARVWFGHQVVMLDYWIVLYE
jgi:hypothetical protein